MWQGYTNLEEISYTCLWVTCWFMSEEVSKFHNYECYNIHKTHYESYYAIYLACLHMSSISTLVRTHTVYNLNKSSWHSTWLCVTALVVQDYWSLYSIIYCVPIVLLFVCLVPSCDISTMTSVLMYLSYALQLSHRLCCGPCTATPGSLSDMGGCSCRYKHPHDITIRKPPWPASCIHAQGAAGQGGTPDIHPQRLKLIYASFAFSSEIILQMSFLFNRACVCWAG